MIYPKNVLIYDIECATYGYDISDTTNHKMKFFGAYSYKTKQYYIYQKLSDIQKIIDQHKFIVGFNTKNYDNPIIEQSGIDIMYKVKIDLFKVIQQRMNLIKFKDSVLAYHLPSLSLDVITQVLGLTDAENKKLDFDYTLFNKEEFTEEEIQLIENYTKRDIEITKKLWEYIYDTFDSWKHHLSPDDKNKLKHLTCAPSVYAYKVICNKVGIEEVYDDKAEYTSNLREGGYVAYPGCEKLEGNIYCLDFACLPKGTTIRMGYKNNSNRYDKKIEDISTGDIVVNEDGCQEIGAIQKEKYDGELFEFELENGNIVSCTPTHKFPIIRDNKEMVVEAQNILDTDDFITTRTKRGNRNANYQNAIIPMICDICGTEHEGFKSQLKKGCCKECSNILKSRNSKKTNLGKTKYDTPHLMKMSIDRTGKKINKKLRKKISKATKEAMKRPEVKKNFLEGNKTRNKDFFKDIEWHRKCARSRQKSIANGKYKYKNINMRSNWEVIVAKNLDKNNIKWKYEPDFFKLEDGKFYCPDFYLPDFDKYIEVKGYMYDHSRLKIQQFQKEHDLLLLNNLNTIEDTSIKWLK